jgi:sugar phosphate isomerase/epimerase
MNDVSRRSFMTTMLAVSGGAGVFPTVSSVALARADSKNPALGGGGFKLGLVTYNLAKDWDVPTILRNCQETGFEAVELRTTHHHGVEPSLDKSARAEVRRRFLDSKVRLLSLGSTCEYHSPDAAVVSRNIEETKRFVELAHDLGALAVKVRPNGLPRGISEEQTLEQIGRALRQCGQAAKDSNVEIWLEVHGEATCVPARIERIMKAADHPQVGVCWNSNPEDVQDGSVAHNFDLLLPWLRNAHINELWNPNYPWRELFHLLKQCGYNRYTLAEIAESSDPVRLMHYYRALWLELQHQGLT